MKKIIIFGSTGMLGNYLSKYLSLYFSIVKISRDEYDIENDDDEKLKKIFQNNEKNSIIVNCAGVIPQRTTEKSMQKYFLVNSLFPHKLQLLADIFDFKFLHITTDCVYDGKNGNYIELDLHTEKNIYGLSKSLGEPKKCTIIRTSIIGEEKINKCSFIEWVKSNKDSSINGYIDHYWNGVTCLKLSQIIHKIIINNLFWEGVKHIYSPNITTKYTLCKYINEIYSLNITVNEFNTEKIDKTLSSIYPKIFNIEDIYIQIEEQKKFGCE